jgi:peptidoglycan/LPS O-acetylase OafA/YrhL
MNQINHSLNHIPALDGIRILLILLIMLSHCEFLADTENPFLSALYNYTLHNATFAVDFFFMLSGFGICYAALHRPEGLHSFETSSARGFRRLVDVSFAWMHIKRIYPVYLLGLLLSLPYSVLSIMSYHAGLAVPLGESAVLFAGCLTMLQSLTGTMALSHALNGVNWYLSCFFIILLLLPNALRILCHDHRHFQKTQHSLAGFRIIFFYGCILVLTLLFGALEQHAVFLYPLDDLVYGSPYLRIFYVLIGAYTALRMEEGGTIPSSQLSFALYAFAFLWQFGLRNFTDLTLGLPFLFRRAVDVPLAASMLYVLASRSMAGTADPLLRILSGSFLCRFKKQSMLLFLLHFPIRNYGILLFNRYGHTESAVSALVCATLIFLVSFAFTFSVALLGSESSTISK